MQNFSFKSLLLALLISSTSYGQSLPPSLVKAMKVRSIGPGVMSGRITTVDAVQANPAIIYAGAASGGVWKTENGGGTWAPIFDGQPTLNIGSLAIQQSNPSVVWVGTGEGNPRNSVSLGEGIFKSLDAGKTWQRMGLEKTRNIHRVIIDPTNPNVVYAGAIGNPYAEHAERGVFKTTNGGKTWEKILFTNEKSGVADMIMDPANPQKILVAMWEHRRTPYDFQSGGPGSGLYLTHDGGQSWTKLGKEHGLPEGNFGRCGVAISPANPDRMYALIEAKKNGLYGSSDGGFTWTKITDDPEIATNRPFYFNDIIADPINENKVYTLWQTVNVSIDGGKTFKTAAGFDQAHADHHALWIHPKDPSYIINGNDGGLSISRDGGKKWIFSEGIPIGQFYHINVDNETPYNVYGGLQDNGSWRGPAYTWMSEGIRNYLWQSVWGGDGFDVLPDPDNARYGYAMSQGGNLGRFDIETGQSYSLRPPAPDLATRLRFNWNAALAQDPLDNNTIYYGSQFVHKSTDKGKSWTIISPDLTTNNPIKQKQDESGGLSLDVTSAENNTTILAIAPSYTEKGVIWVTTDDGNVQLTRDGGQTWTNLRDRIPGLPKEAWIPQVKVTKKNPAEAYVVANQYRMGDFTPYIFRTRDYGKSWERLVDDQKVRGYALCVLPDPEVPNLIFAGTEHGLWISTDDGKGWTQWQSGIPSASVMDLAIQEREADLVIGTFGRSLYVLDDIRPLRALASDPKTLNKKLMAFSSPAAYLSKTKDIAGYGSGGDGLYQAANRSRMARLTYYLNPGIQETPAPGVPPVAKKAEKKTAREDVTRSIVIMDSAKIMKMDTVKIGVYDASGKLVRSFTDKVDTIGIQRTTWDLRERGIRQPGSQKPKPNAPEPTGLPVVPGTYRVVFSYKDLKDSTTVEVLADPRLEYNKPAILARRAMADRLAETARRLTDVIDRLNEADHTVKQLTEELKGSQSESWKGWDKKLKAMQDTLKGTRELIEPKPLGKQGYGRPYRQTALTVWRDAYYTVAGTPWTGSKPFMPNAEDEQMIRDAEALATQAIGKVDQFFDTHWASFRKEVQDKPSLLFKNITD
jgi:photosystem II stability/assembly factor-like uncharacterized protein